MQKFSMTQILKSNMTTIKGLATYFVFGEILYPFYPINRS
jgi:hypothetical protein